MPETLRHDIDGAEILSGEPSVLPYRCALAATWNATLAGTKTPLFLFDRGYMDYHADRFADCSAIGEIAGRAVALFPASIDRDSNHMVSHGGLTFGGPLFIRDLRSSDAMDLIARWLEWLREQGIARATVKLIPPAFACYPTDEVAYALWRHGFSLDRRDLSSILPLTGSLPFNASKKASIKKARKLGIELERPTVAQFHALLSAVLDTRHQVAPVHSAGELTLLAERFPDRIVAHGAFADGTLLGGALVFDYGHIWHTQYMAVSGEGRDSGALDLVIADIIAQAQARRVDALSFGASSEAGGTVLNDGLLWQKESYGARALVHDFMSLDL